MDQLSVLKSNKETYHIDTYKEIKNQISLKQKVLLNPKDEYESSQSEPADEAETIILKIRFSDGENKFKANPNENIALLIKKGIFT